mgnify:CR=1 FL=1
MVKDYRKPTSLAEALALLREPGAVALAGGTFALIGEEHGDRPDIALAVDVAELLPRSIARQGNGGDSRLVIGAGVSFQELADAQLVPACLRAAALTMANRNTRNRATVGGNLGANKSCASLVPILLALDAVVEYAVAAAGAKAGAKPGPSGQELELDVKIGPLEQWLAEPRGILLSVAADLGAGLFAASGRASRTACDLATATVGVRYRLEGEGSQASPAGALPAGVPRVPRGLRVALGGFGPHARLYPEIAALFEGKPLPPKADIEAAVEPLLEARPDQRGGAAYKKRRGAVILADALYAAEALA